LGKKGTAKLTPDLATENITQPNCVVSAVATVARYYGQGKKSDFISNVYAKAVGAFEPLNSHKTFLPWQIFNRFCDFGLIAQYGPMRTRSWQWQGDQLLFLDDREALFPSILVDCEGFSSLSSSNIFDEVSVWTGISNDSQPIVLKYQATTNMHSLHRILAAGQGGFPVVKMESLIDALPSAWEVFDRQSRSTAGDLVTEGLEYRACCDDDWRPYEPGKKGGSYLLRKRDEYSPSYQFWLMRPAHTSLTELVSSDWILLLLWWAGGRRWPIKYMRSTQTLIMPLRLFSQLPDLVRQGLIQRHMRWPKPRYSGDRKVIEIESITPFEARTLSRLYEHAFEIDYV
jgi:hypothetical protein